MRLWACLLFLASTAGAVPASEDPPKDLKDLPVCERTPPREAPASEAAERKACRPAEEPEAVRAAKELRDAGVLDVSARVTISQKADALAASLRRPSASDASLAPDSLSMIGLAGRTSAAKAPKRAPADPPLAAPRMPKGATRVDEAHVDHLMSAAGFSAASYLNNPEFRRIAAEVVASGEGHLRFSDIYSLRARANWDAARGKSYTARYAGEGFEAYTFRARAALAAAVDVLGAHRGLDFALDLVPTSGFWLSMMQYEVATQSLVLSAVTEAAGAVGCKAPGINAACQKAGQIAAPVVEKAVSKVLPAVGEAAAKIARTPVGRYLEERLWRLAKANEHGAARLASRDGAAEIEKSFMAKLPSGQVHAAGDLAQRGERLYRYVHPDELERIVKDGGLVPKAWSETAGAGIEKLGERYAKAGSPAEVLRLRAIDNADAKALTYEFTTISSRAAFPSSVSSAGAIKIEVKPPAGLKLADMSKFSGAGSQTLNGAREAGHVAVTPVASTNVWIHRGAASYPIDSPEGRAIVSELIAASRK